MQKVDIAVGTSKCPICQTALVDSVPFAGFPAGWHGPTDYCPTPENVAHWQATADAVVPDGNWRLKQFGLTLPPPLNSAATNRRLGRNAYGGDATQTFYLAEGAGHSVIACVYTCALCAAPGLVLQEDDGRDQRVTFYVRSARDQWKAKADIPESVWETLAHHSRFVGEVTTAARAYAKLSGTPAFADLES